MILLVVCEGHLRYGGPAIHKSVGQNGWGQNVGMGYARTCGNVNCQKAFNSAVITFTDDVLTVPAGSLFIMALMSIAVV